MTPDQAALQQAFGRKLRELRHARGISQEQLGIASDLHRTYISDVERGARNVSLGAIVAFARGLGVTAAELLAGIDAPIPAIAADDL